MESNHSIVSGYRKQGNFVVVIFGIFITLVIITGLNTCFALNFSNYTSERYHIQFQYPSTWEVTEKMGRFDEGVDLKISDPNLSGWFLIQFTDDPVNNFAPSDLLSTVYDLFKDAIGDYKYDYTVIEQPSFTTIIDGHKAGTFVYAMKDKYEDYAQRWGTQEWIVFEGNSGHIISFMAPASTFDNAENTLIRNQFIKSIVFVGQGNSTNTNTTNIDRFAQ